MWKPYSAKDNIPPPAVANRAKAVTAAVITYLWPTGEDMLPPNIGEFNGTKALPKGEYPVWYCWIDTSRGGQLALSFNAPLLEDLCYVVAEQKSIPITPEIVDLAKTLFINTMTNGFKEIMEMVIENFSIETLPEGSLRKGSRKPSPK